MALPPQDRDEVAEALWQCVGPDEVSLARIAELHRRLGAIDRGEVQMLPGEEVMRELRQRFYG